jgi:hypothetical protein
MFFLLVQQNCIAQRTCGTMEAWQNQLAKNPDLLHQRAIIQSQMQEWINNPENHKTNAIITIPVVVHVVYRNTAENISDAQIQSQIDVLNKDFRKQNSDASLVPSAFSSLAADCEIQFCLADRDPNGNPTTGITRTSTTKTSFSQSSDDVKSSASGGKDPWDTEKYLNMWVCNLSGGLLGYAQFPGGSASTDGVVMRYTAFGTTGTATAPYNKGRTTTHEVAHYLDLYHIWGDEPNCAQDDDVSDTPLQQDKNFGCPTFPLTDNCQTSSPGVMFMNYMDYVDDDCMYMFTTGQKTRMRASLNTTRAGLKASNGCSSASIHQTVLSQSEVVLYPNPITDKVFIKTEKTLKNVVIKICDGTGRILYQNYEKLADMFILDLHNYTNGVYFLTLTSEEGFCTKKLIIQQK